MVASFDVKRNLGLSQAERKKFHIIRAPAGSRESLGARVITRQLLHSGITLSEDTVRYHLRMMDECGLTRLVTRRNGRQITERNLAELKPAATSRRDAAPPGLQNTR